ncbi:MAG: hypothetical protein CMJ46_13255 [Planctomyces sp.]|nr:hypothetical protein [Planctomyces sp.]
MSELRRRVGRFRIVLFLAMIILAWCGYRHYARTRFLYQPDLRIEFKYDEVDWFDWIPAKWRPYFETRIPITLQVQSDEQLEEMLDHFDVSRVTEVRTAPNSTAFTGKGLENLSEFKSLRSLTLYETRVRDEDLLHLTELQSLQDLSLEKNSLLTTEGLKFLNDVPHLSNLKLGIGWDAGEAWETACRLPHIPVTATAWTERPAVKHRLTDADFELLTRPIRTSFRQLPGKSYRLEITEKSLSRLKYIPALRDLSLSGLPITNEGVALLTELELLEELNLNDTEITDGCLVDLVMLTSLERLSVARTKITDQFFPTLAGGTGGLERISLSGCNLTAESLVYIQLHPNAHFLDLSDCPLEGSFVKQPMEFGSPLTLDFTRSGITDEHLMALNWVKLMPREVYINDEPVYSDIEMLDALTGNRFTTSKGAVWSLNLSETGISDEALQHLGTNRNLFGLDVSKTGITNVGVAHLKFPVPVDANAPGFSLNLSHTKITDAAIQSLIDNQQHLRITSLDLSDTVVSDEGVKLLLQFSRLNHVDVSNTKVTAAAGPTIYELRSKRIHHLFHNLK